MPGCCCWCALAGVPKGVLWLHRSSSSTQPEQHAAAAAHYYVLLPVLFRNPEPLWWNQYPPLLAFVVSLVITIVSLCGKLSNQHCLVDAGISAPAASVLERSPR